MQVGIFLLFLQDHLFCILKNPVLEGYSVCETLVYIKKKKPSSDSHVTAQHTQYRIFHVDKIKKKKLLIFCVVYIHLNCYHQIEVNLRKNI